MTYGTRQRLLGSLANHSSSGMASQSRRAYGLERRLSAMNGYALTLWRHPGALLARPINSSRMNRQQPNCSELHAASRLWISSSVFHACLHATSAEMDINARNTAHPYQFGLDLPDTIDSACACSTSFHTNLLFVANDRCDLNSIRG